MDNVVNVGLSRQMVLRRELDILANNVANVDTAGFKVESLIVETKTERLPSGGDGSNTVSFVLDAGVARNFRQGAMKQTGATFDFALEGEGFFRLQTPQGERYSRDGRFALDAQGRLIGQSGHPVQGDGGDIVIDPNRGAPKVAADGTVSQDGQTVGKIAAVGFASLSALAKDGSGLYRNLSDVQPQGAPDTRIRQGMVETSNVQAVVQMTRLIEVTRAYESISRLMQQTGDLSSDSINRLGKLN